MLEVYKFKQYAFLQHYVNSLQYYWSIQNNEYIYYKAQNVVCSLRYLSCIIHVLWDIYLYIIQNDVYSYNILFFFMPFVSSLVRWKKVQFL